MSLSSFQGGEGNKQQTNKSVKYNKSDGKKYYGEK